MVPGYNSTVHALRGRAAAGTRRPGVPRTPTGGPWAVAVCSLQFHSANGTRSDSIPVEAFLVSAGVIALGEIGDKTQLLALLLAARFKKPLPIVAGIFVATLANHALAGFLGNLFRAFVPDEILRWLLALAFLAVAIWTLKPDRSDDEEALPTSRWGVFGVTAVAFFLAEMGDKTQIATVVMAAQFSSLAAVVLGTTCGMLVADVPVVLLGNVASAKIPFKAVRIAAALLFVAMGAYALLAPELPGR
jgi:putative Ca2+/H+ antiporter (TMEM165/GDT1 family)